LLALAALLGFIAYVMYAVAAVEHRSRCRAPRHVVALHRIETAAQAYFQRRGHFPVARATTSLDPVWAVLGVSVYGLQHARFSYESTDGRTLVVHAFTDFDADGAEATWSLTLAVVNSKLARTLTPPPHGVY
jgi:hypothetical protein